MIVAKDHGPVDSVEALFKESMRRDVMIGRSIVCVLWGVGWYQSYGCRFGGEKEGKPTTRARAEFVPDRPHRMSALPFEVQDHLPEQKTRTKRAPVDRES